jgi:hypothetical protein
MSHLAYNMDAHKRLVDGVYRAFCLHCHTAELIVGTQETINQSRALIANIDAVLAKNTPPGWLWPAY